MTDYHCKCDDCGRFMRSGTWAGKYDFVAMEPSYMHWRCTRCTERLGPVESNARPANGDMTQYQGVLP